MAKAPIELHSTSGMKYKEAFDLCYDNAQYHPWNRSGIFDTGNRAYIGKDIMEILTKTWAHWHPLDMPENKNKEYWHFYHGHRSIVVKLVEENKWLVTNANK